MSDATLRTIELSPDRTEPDDEWSMFVAGDYALSRESEATAASTVSPELRERIAGATATVVNVEAPIFTEGMTPIAKSGPSIQNPVGAADAVADAGFDICTLANNHVLDYGQRGLETTVDALRAVGCETVGVGDSLDAALEPLKIAGNGASVGLLNVCEQEFNIAREDRGGAAALTHPRAREAIRAADDEFDTVVVIAHAGTEYVPFPAPELQRTLREFIDIGADLVVGHHPHVPQGWEHYGSGAIFYSLGNFLYDRMADDENMSWGLAIEIEFDGPTPVAVELVPTDTVDGVVHPLDQTRDHIDHIEYLHRLAEITADPRSLEPYWQEVAIQEFYERYSDWLHSGCGVDLALARSAPNDPDTQRSFWNPDARRHDLLTLLNVVRMSSHRWVMTTALAVLAGETPDRRTPETKAEAQSLRDRTARSR
jgi:poly-gamma-glutamate synthesis protein (capsule biosynthesis protein)